MKLLVNITLDRLPASNSGLIFNSLINGISASKNRYYVN